MGALLYPVTVLLYDGPLLCGFNVAIKGLKAGDVYHVHGVDVI